MLMTKSDLSVPRSFSHQVAEGRKEFAVVVKCNQLLREGRELCRYVVEGRGAFLSLHLPLTSGYASITQSLWTPRHSGLEWTVGKK